MNFYSIYDSALEQYLNPFLAPNNATAVRAIQLDMQRPDTQLKPATDFTLYMVGVWNKETGQITPQPPQQIVPCVALTPKE